MLVEDNSGNCETEITAEDSTLRHKALRRCWIRQLEVIAGYLRNILGDRLNVPASSRSACSFIRTVVVEKIMPKPRPIIASNPYVFAGIEWLEPTV